MERTGKVGQFLGLTSWDPRKSGWQDSKGKSREDPTSGSSIFQGGGHVSFKSNVQKKLWSPGDDCCFFVCVGDDHLCIQVVEEDYPKDNEPPRLQGS